MFSGSCAWRLLRCGSISAGLSKSGSLAGKAYSRCADDADGLWRGTPYPEADIAVLCRVLRTGRLCDGIGDGGWRCSYGERYILHKCGFRRTADCGFCCLYCADGSVPGICREENSRPAGTCDPGMGRTAGTIDCFVRYGKCFAGSCDRPPGFGSRKYAFTGTISCGITSYIIVWGDACSG